jgi:hypothetical protein
MSPPHLPMVGTESAFAGVMRKVTLLGAPIERTDSVCAQRAEAHGRYVEDGCAVGNCAIRTADRDPKRRRCVRPGSDGMAQPLVAVGVHVILRAERPFIEDILRPLINQRTLVPAERQAVFFVFEKVLAHFRPYSFEHKSKMRRDRVIAQYCVASLNKIDGTKQSKAGEDRNEKDEKRDKAGLPESQSDEQESCTRSDRVESEARREWQKQDVHCSCLQS